MTAPPLSPDDATFRPLPDALPLGVVMLAPGSRPVYANTAAARMLGYDSPAALLRAAPEERHARFRMLDAAGQPLPPDRYPAARALAGAEEAAAWLWARGADGRERRIEVRARPLRDAAGLVWLALATFADVTEAGAAGRREQMPAEASRVMAEAGRNLRAALDTLARLVAGTLGDGCAVHLLDESGTHLDLAAIAHPDAEALASIRALLEANPPALDSPAARLVLGRGLPLLVPRVAPAALRATLPPTYEPHFERFAGPHSLLAVPLLADGRVLGAITAGRDAPGRPYTKADRDLLLEVGRRVALAVENARLHAAERRARAEAERAAERAGRLQAVTATLSEALTPAEVAAAVLEQAVVALGAHSGAAFLLGPGGDALDLVASVGYPADLVAAWRTLPLDGPSVAAGVVRSGAPQWLDSTDSDTRGSPHVIAMRERLGNTAFAVLPLATRGRVLGALALNFSGARGFGDAAERGFLQALARQCAQALERARLLEAERRTSDRTARLQAVTAALSVAATPEAVAEVAVGEGLAALGADAGAVYVLTDAGRTFEALAFAGYPAELEPRHRRAPADAPGPLREALEGRAVVTATSPDELLARWPRLAAAQQRSGDAAIATAPLLVGQRTLGVLHVAFRTPRVLAAGDLALLEALARQCGAALERARLLDAERQARAEAEAARGGLALLATAGGLLASALDADATLREVARLVVPMLADWCIVDVLEGGGARRVATVAADPAKERALLALAERYPAALGAPQPLSRVLTSGQPLLIPAMDAAALAGGTEDAEHARLVAALAPGAIIAVPLPGRGRTLGALGLVRSESGRRYGAEDLALATELGRRVGLALDNARLYAEAREAVRARDEFLAIAAHELRTPVTGLKGTAQLALRARERGTLDDARLERSLATLNRAADRLAALTDDLLDVSRLRLGRLPFEPRPLDLAALVREAVERCHERLDGRHALDLTGADAPLVLPLDPERIGQVLDNLLENAVKYSPGGGTVRIALAAREGGALLRVSDAGIGLPPGSLEAIFEPFGRAPNAANSHIAGMGLGLYICRSIAELHGGRLWATSPGEGRGTSLHLWLPRGPAA